MNTKITVSRTELFNKLNIVKQAISSKDLIPDHDNFLFEVYADKLFVTGADAENNITTMIEHELLESEGCKFLISHGILLEGIKELPEQPIVILIEGQKASITHEQGIFNLPVKSADNYSMLSKEADATTFEISSDILYRSIKAVSGYAADDTLRPTMNGIYVECGSKLSFVASNASILAEMEYEQQLPECNFILPIKTSKIIASLLKDTETVKLTIGPKTIRTTIDNTDIVARLVEGNYPNYRGVIPVDNDKELVVFKNDILGSIKRTSLFADQKTPLIKLDASVNQLTITGKNSDFNQEAKENLKPESYTGDPIEIGFKASFLKQCFETVNHDYIKMTMSESNRAALISPLEEEDSKLTILIMPMLINV